MPGVFLSYRRTDADFALEIYNSLRGRWGRHAIFWDTESIELGAPWADSIRQAVRRAEAVIVLIGPGWTTVEKPPGQRRLDDPTDWVRQEITEAFDAERPIVPVLAPGANALRPDELPTPLVPLAALQAIRMENRRFATRLVQSLTKHLGPIDPGAALEIDPLRGERLTRLLGNQTRRLQTRASELIREHESARALDELTEGTEVIMTLLDFAPADPHLGLHLGYVYKTIGQAYESAGQPAESHRYFQLARVVFERIQDLGDKSGLPDADRAGAINGLGAVYQHDGDPVAAMQAFREATQILPSYAYAWHDLLAIRLHLAEKYGLVDLPAISDALANLQRTAVKHPGLGQKILTRLAHWTQDLTNRVRDPQTEPAAEDWISFAYQRLEQGQAELALAPLDEAVAAGPHIPEAWLYRGIARVGAGQLLEGLADLEKTLELRPGLELAYYNGACAHALLGNERQALDWLAESLAREPGRHQEATRDPHFATLRANSRFRELTGGAS